MRNVNDWGTARTLPSYRNTGSSETSTSLELVVRGVQVGLVRPLAIEHAAEESG